MVVLDFSKPWLFLSSLKQWMEVLEEQLNVSYDECAETGLDTENESTQVKWFQVSEHTLNLTFLIFLLELFLIRRCCPCRTM